MSDCQLKIEYLHYVNSLKKAFSSLSLKNLDPGWVIKVGDIVWFVLNFKDVEG